jgi:hypothetical protein
MFDGQGSWQLHTGHHFAWQFSAAKGLMGACPHMRMFHPG